ncbi:DUF5683 domain-containing protein [Winogradskyella endarachnes]|uniref:DUF5683 domain-containing protein n=1 Tax=Winogradskyella endarachnes TaxID=2681965 RepID=A0A6L6U6L0_9FLAO|nr:DUF5683 domain-containing protein [Winogradskyella endarachnes]MUU77609.1 hypothetical protein [Winogradskyella endarachnes]
MKPNKNFLAVLWCIISLLFTYAQTEIETDSTRVAVNDKVIISTDSIVKTEIDPLRPAKAAFLSAVLPGLGQAYNKRYWKIPIVIGAITGGILVYDFNTRQLNRYRDAYKRRLAGFKDDEFYGDGDTPNISTDALVRAQTQARRNKDLSLLVTFGFYALNILDANIDAHLLQFNVDENLSLSPHYQYNELENTSDLGLTLNFKF